MQSLDNVQTLVQTDSYPPHISLYLPNNKEIEDENREPRDENEEDAVHPKLVVYCPFSFLELAHHNG